MPKEHKTFSLSITFRQEADIQEAKELLNLVCTKAGFKQGKVFLHGLRSLATMINKAKGLVKA